MNKPIGNPQPKPSIKRTVRNLFPDTAAPMPKVPVSSDTLFTQNPIDQSCYQAPPLMPVGLDGGAVIGADDEGNETMRFSVDHPARQVNRRSPADAGNTTPAETTGITEDSADDAAIAIAPIRQALHDAVPIVDNKSNAPDFLVGKRKSKAYTQDELRELGLDRN